MVTHLQFSVTLTSDMVSHLKFPKTLT